MVDGKGEAAVQRDRLDLEKRKKHERQAWFGWAGSTRVRLVINVLAGLLLLVSLHWAITHAVAFVFATTAQGRGSASTLTTVPVLLWSEPDADNETLPGPRTLPGHTLDDEELQNATESLQLESATREYAASAARDPGALNDDPRHLHTYVDVHGDFGPGEDGKARLLKYKTASAAVDEPGVSLTHGCPDMRFGASCKVHLCTTRAYLPGRNFLARARNRDDHDGAWFRRKALLRLMLRGREYGYAASQTQDQQEIPRHVRPAVYQLDPALGLNEHLLGLTRVLAQALKEDRPLAVLDPNHAWATRHAQNDRNHKHPDVNLGICSTIGVNMSTVGGKHRTLPRRFDCFVNPLPFYTASIVRFGHFAALTRPPDDTNDEFGESAATSVATLLRIRHGDGSDSTTAGAIAASHVLRADHQHPPPPRMWYAQPPPMAPWNSNSWTAQPPPPPRPGFNQGKAMTAAAAADYEATRDLLDRFDAISARQAVREAENATESDVDGDNLWQDDENMEQLRQNFGMKNASAEKLVVTKDAPTMGDDDHSFSEDLGLPGRRRQLLKKKKRMPSPPPPSTFDEFMRYYHANSTERKEIQKERESTEKERVEKIKRGEQGEKALKDLKREAFRDHVERKMNNEKVKEDLYVDLEVSHAANKAINEAFEKGQIYVAPPQPPLPPPESLENDDIRIDADALAAAARDAAIPADETSNVVVEHKTLGTVIVGAGTSTEDRATIERMRDNDRRGNSDEFDQRTELEPATSGEVNELAHQLGIHRKAPPQPPSLRPLEEITEDSTEEFFYSAEGRTKFVSPPPAPYPPSPPLDGVSPPPLPFPPPTPQPPFYNCSEDNACPPPAPMAPDQPPAPPLNASERIVPLHETFQEQAEDLLKKSYGEDGRGVGVALAADLAEGVADAPADDTVGSTDDEDRLDLDAVDTMLTGGAVSSLRKRGFGLRVDVSYAKAIENGEPAIEAEVVLTIGTGADSVDFDEESNPSSEHSNVLGQFHPQPTSHQVDVGKMGTTLRSSHLTVGPSTTTMGDLIPGALYVARVRYRSESGWGPFSPPTEYRAPTATELANRKGGGGVGKHFKAPSLGRSPPAPWPPRAPEGTSLSMAIPDELKSWAQGKSPEGGFVSEDEKEGRRFSLISRGRDALLNYRRNP
ncbi:hypothetical protein PPROV_001046400 [Pycnococcus provasolii]|uniref:Fibronectin type-III domain-containing protein n=1 Tax=Pycnococcus provasolii TaxID=41880 RepID=A0A830HWC5_9CHLO|nr:hypothetical protein PPROV_001046400 [Pycnococcus provasolii]